VLKVFSVIVVTLKSFVLNANHTTLVYAPSRLNLYLEDVTNNLLLVGSVISISIAGISFLPVYI